MSCQPAIVKASGNPIYNQTRIESTDPLIQIFGNKGRIETAIALLREDRIHGTEKLKDFLSTFLLHMRDIDEQSIKKDPLNAVLVLMLKGDESEHLRTRAVEAYKTKYPNDERFEAAYFFLKAPDIFIAHLLISGNMWVCSNQENLSFYDEQIAGMFQGTIAFDVGDSLSAHEVSQIQSHETDVRFPFAQNLVEKQGKYEVTNWCSSPPLRPTEHRCDDLFIGSRRIVHNQILTTYIKELKDSSKIIEEIYSLPNDCLHAIAVIGPYGAGKSCFIEKKFTHQPMTIFSLDTINQKLITSTSNSRDHHFEAMMLTRELLKQLSTVPTILIEVAAIDKFRFERMINRDYPTRKIIIEEIATISPEASIEQFTKREREHQPLVSQEKIGVATQSANDALKYRLDRINMVVEYPEIVYMLHCQGSEVARVKKGNLTIAEGYEELFHTLTRLYHL